MLKYKLDKLRPQNDESKSIFAQRLKSARMRKGLSQEVVAKKIAYVRGSIANWETDTIPPLDIVLQLCNLYEVDIDYLLDKQTVEEKDIHAVANELHLSEQSIKKLKASKTHNYLIDTLVSSALYKDIYEDFSEIVAHETLLEILDSSFSPKLKREIEECFDKYFLQTPLYDIDEAGFSRFLKDEFNYVRNNDIATFLRRFNYDGKLFLQRAYNLDTLSNEDKYNAIIATLSKISFDILYKNKILIIKKSGLIKKIETAIDEAVKNEHNASRDNRRKFANSIKQK